MAAHAKAILLADCLEDAITEVAYQAELAGLHSHVSYEDPAGLELSISGFSEKLVSLAKVIVQVGLCCAAAEAHRSTAAHAALPVLRHNQHQHLQQ